ncbi:MAG: ATPase, partial [Desulfuromonas sp.]
MIIAMSKVEIVGPKRWRLELLDLLREQELFQPEVDLHGYLPEASQPAVRSLLPEANELEEKLFLERLLKRVNELIQLLPDTPLRRTFLSNPPLIDALSGLVAKHLQQGRQMRQELENLHRQGEELAGYLHFWQTLEILLPKGHRDSSLRFFGITIRDPSALPLLRRRLEKESDGACRLATATTEEGSMVALITVAPSFAAPLQELLSGERLPELPIPAELASLPLTDRGEALKKRIEALAREMEGRRSDLVIFAKRWLPLYRQAQRWVMEQLGLYQASAAAYETRQCFVIHGWLARADFPALKELLHRRCGDEVVVAEIEVLQRDLDQVPVLLRNPPWLRPFEMFARLLPLPNYTSYDPTPFLALFFPPIFGLILGDLGYGLILLLLALAVTRWGRRPLWRDAGCILIYCALYASLFGILFGEFFGELGRHLFNLHPLWMERSRSIVPMLVFALSLGGAHVLFGIALGLRDKLRRGEHKAALHRGTEMLLLLSLALLLLDLFGLISFPFASELPKAVLLLVLGLLLSGGMLAPLELLKSIGHIISYVRIMAIGLSSVLLAEVANRLGGMTGDLVAGILVAGILHLFNLVL